MGAMVGSAEERCCCNWAEQSFKGAGDLRKAEHTEGRGGEEKNKKQMEFEIKQGERNRT